MQAATAHPQSEALSLMPQLDGVRAIAISAVLLAHFPVFPALVQIYAMQPGQLGVRLFFVLSGFLITRILLHCRDLVESGTVSLGAVLRRFYTRRALRIFPLYFLVVGVFAWLGAPNVREHLVWHLTYTTNFRMAALASNLFPAGHFWSLAIEEQVSAVWPLLTLVLPRRWLGPGL